VNGRQTGIELFPNRVQLLWCFLRREWMRMDFRAINLEMFEPHRLIEVLKTDLQVGEQLFEHFREQSLRTR
jgi:hypothetical protein